MPSPINEVAKAEDTKGLSEEEAIARIEKLADDLMKYVAGCADARTWGGPTLYPKHPVDETRAYADAKALRRVIALRSEREELEARCAAYAETITMQYKALEGARSWIADTVRGAKAEGATIGVIATGGAKEGLWTRTRRVRRSIAAAMHTTRTALRKAQGSDHG